MEALGLKAAEESSMKALHYFAAVSKWEAEKASFVKTKKWDLPAPTL